ncbi:MAG: hypothetical protein ACRDK3_04040, partial [Actinomycetota bacterium]
SAGRTRSLEMSIVLIACAPIVWFGQAFGLSRIMNRRGFHPLPWFAVGVLLGPVVWPLALLEAISGLPPPEQLRRGRPGSGAIDVFVVLDRDELPDPLASQMAHLRPYCRRIVIGRVIKAGGPVPDTQDAENFLRRIAHQLKTDEAELQILYGDMRQAVEAIHKEGGFGIVLRGDRPEELFDDEGKMQNVRCLRDVKAA